MSLPPSLSFLHPSLTLSSLLARDSSSNCPPSVCPFHYHSPFHLNSIPNLLTNTKVATLSKQGQFTQMSVTYSEPDCSAIVRSIIIWITNSRVIMGCFHLKEDAMTTCGQLLPNYSFNNQHSHSWCYTAWTAILSCSTNIIAFCWFVLFTIEQFNCLSEKLSSRFPWIW